LLLGNAECYDNFSCTFDFPPDFGPGADLGVNPAIR